MKHLKRFNESIDSTEESLKSRLKSHYAEISSDYDEEEIENAIQILDEYDDNLDGLSKMDKILLLRLIDDNDLYETVNNINPSRGNRENPFD
jgi:tRNA (Thr-GGU) A37 N-methylase